MTRYEAWLLIPVWVCYYFWRSRDPVKSAVLLVVLVAFPLYWMYANYLHLGDPLPGGTMTFEGVQPVTLPMAGSMLLWKSIAHLGWLPPLLPAGIIGGALLVLVWSSKGKVSPEQILHLAMAGVLWCFLVWFVAARGDFQDRVLLCGFVIVLPFAGLLYAWLWAHRPRPLLTAAVLTMASFPLSLSTCQLSTLLARQHEPSWPMARLADTSPRYFVTFRAKHGMDQLARWLATSSYRDDALVMTEMAYRSVYLPLYLPDIGGRYFIVTRVSIDDKIARFLQSQHPGLLITIKEDEGLQSRIEKYLSAKIEPEELVHTEGDVRVYDIRNLAIGTDAGGFRTERHP